MGLLIYISAPQSTHTSAFPSPISLTPPSPFSGYTTQTIPSLKKESSSYIYAVLHHPLYRERYSENLKRELPRIPFAPDFRAFADAGAELAHLHLGYESLEPWPLEYVEQMSVPFTGRVSKIKLSKDCTAIKINESLTLAGIPGKFSITSSAPNRPWNG